MQDQTYLKNNTGVDLTLKFAVLLLSVDIFFSYLFGTDILLLLVSCFFLIFSMVQSRTALIRLNFGSFLWILCNLVFFVSVLYSGDQQRGLNFTVTFLFLILAKIALESCDNWQHVFFDCMLVCSSVHVIATLLYLWSPDLIASVCRKILSHELLAENLGLMQYGANAGITGQTGTNSIFLSIFIAIVFGRLLCGTRNKIWYTVLLLVGIFALFLTQKRGILIAAAVAFLLVTMVFSARDSKKKWKYFFLLLFIAGAGFYLLMQNPAAYRVIHKFYSTYQQGDLLTGRLALYQFSIDKFMESPLFGQGLMSISSLYGNDAHNIFIQLLAENGMVGFVIFVFTLMYSFVSSVKTVFNVLRAESGKVGDVGPLLAASLFLQIIFLINGLTGNPLYDFRFLAPYLLAVAVVNTYRTSQADSPVMKQGQYRKSALSPW